MPQQRDTCISIFHALGKLLYAKRKAVNGIHGTTTSSLFGEEETITSYHNSPWNKDKRPPLEFNPEMVLDHCDIGLNGAINFVEYHCPDFFTDIDELNVAFSRFSDAAFLMDKAYVSIRMMIYDDYWFYSDIMIFILLFLNTHAYHTSVLYSRYHQ